MANFSGKDTQSDRNFLSWPHLMLNLDVRSVRHFQPLKKLDSLTGGRFLRSSGNNVLFDGFGSFLSGLVPKARTQWSWDLCVLCGVLASVTRFEQHRKLGVLCTVPSMLSSPPAVAMWISLYGFLILESVFQIGQNHLAPVFFEAWFAYGNCQSGSQWDGKVHLVLFFLALVYCNEGTLLAPMERGSSQSTWALFTFWEALAAASQLHVLLREHQVN